MNRRLVLNTIGKLLLLESVLFILPLIVSVIMGDWIDISAFLVSIAVTALAGFLLFIMARPRTGELYAKEGFIIAAGTWVAFSLFGALPFVFSGSIPNYADALFETVSGLTTTGATVVDDVESLSMGIQFWRCFTHWIGGMGVIVFLMAIIPGDSGRSIHIMRAEMPGITVEKLVPRVNKTAKILYLLYIGLTVLEFLFLLAGGLFMENGMNPYEALLHTFSTAGTGGFGMFNDSCASFNPYTQWVLTIFMLLFGVNFNLYYFIVLKKIGAVFKNSELRLYLSIVIGSTAAISISLWIHRIYETVGETIRQAAFQVAAFVTTTGFVSNADFGATGTSQSWPTLAKALLFVLLFVGGCAGSTGGGLKIARVMVLFKTIRKEFRHLLHPRSVNNVKVDGQTVDVSVVHSVSYYFIIYMICIFATFVGISIFDGEAFGSESLITNLSGAISCFNNVGPAFGWLGTRSYMAYTAVSKILLSIAMLMGRLEIYPILLSVSVFLSRDNGRLRRKVKRERKSENEG